MREDILVTRGINVMSVEKHLWSLPTSEIFLKQTNAYLFISEVGQWIPYTMAGPALMPKCGISRGWPPAKGWKVMAAKHSKDMEGKVIITEVDYNGHSLQKIFYNGAEKDDCVKHKGLQSFGYLEKFIAEKKLENITDEKPATPEYVVEN